MNDYMPTTDDIRDEYVAYLTMEAGEEFYGDAVTAEEARGRFNRWHAAELREAKAEGWDEGREAQRGYAAQMASVLIRWPAPIEAPREPSNPYRADEMEGEQG